MHRIMFVCYGNICRSPLAEYLMKDLVKKNNRENEYQICSSATSYEEIGNPVYPPIKKILEREHIDCSDKISVKLKVENYDKFDFFIIMDSLNELDIKRIFPFDNGKKVKKLMSFTSNPIDVADPWHTRDFEKTFNEIKQGVFDLYNFLENNNKNS